MRVELTCAAKKYNAIENMIEASALAMKKFEETGAHEFLSTYVFIAREIATFCHPKLRAIERLPNDPIKDMTPEQRLEAMRHAVAMLELQVKAEKK